MAEDTTVQVTQRDTEDPPQRDTDEATNTGATQRVAEGEVQGADEQARTVAYASHLKVLDEKKKLQERLRKYEQDEEAALPELERTKKERDTYKKRYEELESRVRHSEAVAASASANAIYPEAVARLIPSDTDDFEAALKDIRKQYPAMFRTSSVDGGAGNNGQAPAATDMNSFIRSAIVGGRKG
jgi:hypothetical protein